MSAEEIALILVWVAVGMVVGMMVYSYVGPAKTATTA